MSKEIIQHQNQKGTVQELTVHDSPPQNSTAERGMRTRAEQARAVRGHHSPPPITPASSDSPRYIPPHKRPNHRQLLETRP